MDSTSVLSWINSEVMKYRPYVKNKVIEIQDLHPVNRWAYIPSTKNNAADLVSKGCDFNHLRAVTDGPEKKSNGEMAMRS